MLATASPTAGDGDAAEFLDAGGIAKYASSRLRGRLIRR